MVSIEYPRHVSLAIGRSRPLEAGDIVNDRLYILHTKWDDDAESTMGHLSLHSETRAERNLENAVTFNDGVNHVEVGSHSPHAAAVRS